MLYTISDCLRKTAVLLLNEHISAEIRKKLKLLSDKDLIKEMKQLERKIPQATKRLKPKFQKNLEEIQLLLKQRGITPEQLLKKEEPVQPEVKQEVKTPVTEPLKKEEPVTEPVEKKDKATADKKYRDLIKGHIRPGVKALVSAWSRWPSSDPHKDRIYLQAVSEDLSKKIESLHLEKKVTPKKVASKTKDPNEILEFERGIDLLSAAYKSIFYKAMEIYEEAGVDPEDIASTFGTIVLEELRNGIGSREDIQKFILQSFGMLDTVLDKLISWFRHV